jgi:hypothetical protein
MTDELFPFKKSQKPMESEHVFHDSGCDMDIITANY